MFFEWKQKVLSFDVDLKNRFWEVEIFFIHTLNSKSGLFIRYRVTNVLKSR